jgi:hypothetical protein
MITSPTRIIPTFEPKEVRQKPAQFLRSQRQGTVIGVPSTAVPSGTKGKVMKRMKDLTKLETITMDVLTGLTLGLAIVVAPLIALATPIDLAVRWLHKRLIPSTS